MAPPMTIPYDYIWKQVNEVIKSRPHINWALVQSMREDVRYILTLGPVGENMRLFIVEPIDSLPGLVEISLTLSPEEFKITQEYFDLIVKLFDTPQSLFDCSQYLYRRFLSHEDIQ